MKRDDIVTCVLSGDYGKPRPAVIVQSNLFNPTHNSIVVCPITSTLFEKRKGAFRRKENENKR